MPRDPCSIVFPLEGDVLGCGLGDHLEEEQRFPVTGNVKE